MNKKQLIVAWIIGIIISLICLNPVRYHGLVRYGRPNIDFIRTIFFIIPILVLGILLIYTLRNTEMAKQIKTDIIKLSSQIYKKIAQLLSRIWLFIKRVFIKELIIFVSTLLIGFIVIGIAGLFPPEPKREKVPESVWALVIKMWNYKERLPEYKNLSALEIAEKLSKENPEYQKDYDNLKAISEENGRNKKFDIATAKPVEETLLEKVLGLIKSYLRGEKIAKYGFFFVLFGYPITLFARFIIWTVRILKEKPK